MRDDPKPKGSLEGGRSAASLRSALIKPVRLKDRSVEEANHESNDRRNAEPQKSAFDDIAGRMVRDAEDDHAGQDQRKAQMSCPEAVRAGARRQDVAINACDPA